MIEAASVFARFDLYQSGRAEPPGIWWIYPTDYIAKVEVDYERRLVVVHYNGGQPPQRIPFEHVYSIIER